MKREFLSVALIGSFALAGGPALAGWRAVSLHPTDPQYLNSLATCTSGGQIAGLTLVDSGGNQGERPALWNSPSSAGFVSLADLPLFSRIRGVSGGIQVGDFAGNAAWWKGTTNRYSINFGEDFQETHLWAVSSGWAAGEETFFSSGQTHPMLWKLTDTNSLPGIDLLPGTAEVGGVYAITGALGDNRGQQAGSAGGANQEGAAYWQGTAASYVDLHPNHVANWVYSVAKAIHGGQQGGWVEDDSRNRHAALWQGTAASFQDIHPSASVVPEDYNSFILGMTEGIQVGYVVPGRKLLRSRLPEGLWAKVAGMFLKRWRWT